LTGWPRNNNLPVRQELTGDSNRLLLWLLIGCFAGCWRLLAAVAAGGCCGCWLLASLLGMLTSFFLGFTVGAVAAVAASASCFNSCWMLPQIAGQLLAGYGCCGCFAVG
jgi:hypothetical protein